MQISSVLPRVNYSEPTFYLSKYVSMGDTCLLFSKFVQSREKRLCKIPRCNILRYRFGTTYND